MAVRYLVGIDEVGRGPLAGPVVIAAVCIPVQFRHAKRLGTFRDSKKLRSEERETWSAYLRSHPQVHYALARVNAPVIDRINIARAANRAARNAFTRLLAAHHIAPGAVRVLLDGGLYLGDKERQREYQARTVVKGDERFRVVAYASILAKVHRDRYMTKQARVFPEYGFERHKGYATREHTRALKKHGRTPLHRLTFTRRYSKI